MKTKINKYLDSWKEKGYPEGIPDEAPLRLMELNKVPSYKQVCIAILKNDITLKSLGLTPKKSIYYSILKKIEIDNRSKKDV